VVAPGARVPAIDPINSGWWVWGTSFATSHVSGLIALQLQYARRTGSPEPINFNEGKAFGVNNGYLWEVMKHSAKQLTGPPPPAPPYPYDPVYQGTGKVWAADTAPIPPDPGDGSIDCMVAKWPLSFAPFTYYGYIGFDEQNYPEYYIGTMMSYDFTLANNTATIGNYPSNIEIGQVLDDPGPPPVYVDVPIATTTQAYYIEHAEAVLPGVPVAEFLADPPYTIYSENPGSIVTLSDNYFLNMSMYPGLDRIKLDLQFKFSDDTNNRLIKVTYPYASIWCPPPLLNEGFPIQ